MTSTGEAHATTIDSGMRVPVIESDRAVLADIYREDVNIAIWNRSLPQALIQSLHHDPAMQRVFKLCMLVTPANVREVISGSLDAAQDHPLIDDVTELVEMFCFLFEIDRAGLRLTTLKHAMCPKFHVDHLPCRLITTYRGVGSEWIPEASVDRSRLIRGDDGDYGSAKPYMNERDIQQMVAGDVAILKGSGWQGNEHAGIVHRSPSIGEGASRLLLTLDFPN